MALGCGASPPTSTQPRTGGGTGELALEKLGSYEAPVQVVAAPGDEDHLYVVEQCGTVRRIPAEGGAGRPFLDLSGQVTCGGEQGLLSIAFDPGYDRTGLLYAHYTDLDGEGRIVELRRDRADPGQVDPGGARELLRLPDFAPNHNGGLLLFGPDGRLWAGTGDGGGAGDPERTAQDRTSPLGKLLIVDPSAPGEFEIAALGLRNPWRFSFDRETGDLWIGDVGQDAREEINSLAASELDKVPNFGWSAFEGSEPFNSDQQAPGALEPVLEYGRERGCSVTGGYVVRDRSLPELEGHYLYGDYCAGELRSFEAQPGEPARDDEELGLTVPALSSFGEDAAGRIYATSLDGPVYRLTSE